MLQPRYFAMLAARSYISHGAAIFRALQCLHEASMARQCESRVYAVKMAARRSSSRQNIRAYRTFTANRDCHGAVIEIATNKLSRRP